MSAHAYATLAHHCTGTMDKQATNSERDNVLGGARTIAQEACIVIYYQPRITRAAHPCKLLQSCRSISQRAGCPRPEARSRTISDSQRNRTNILPAGGTRDSAPHARQLVKKNQQAKHGCQRTPRVPKAEEPWCQTHNSVGGSLSMGRELI